jgi:hypothetical protein
MDGAGGSLSIRETGYMLKLLLVLGTNYKTFLNISVN